MNPTDPDYDRARTAIHGAVDAIFDLIVGVRLAEPTAEHARASQQGPTPATDPERPDFSKLPSRRWAVILELIWDDPDGKYPAIAERAAAKLNQKVTHKDVASFVYLANRDESFKKNFIHPKRRT
jgi:hypothetical protein